jgi:hypothetical protein
MDQDLDSFLLPGFATPQESQDHTDFAEGCYKDDERDSQQRYVEENEGKGRRVQEGYNDTPQFQESTEQLNRPISNSRSTGINTRSGKEHIAKADINVRRDRKSKIKQL